MILSQHVKISIYVVRETQSASLVLSARQTFWKSLSIQLQIQVQTFLYKNIVLHLRRFYLMFFTEVGVRLPKIILYFLEKMTTYSVMLFPTILHAFHYQLELLRGQPRFLPDRIRQGEREREREREREAVIRMSCCCSMLCHQMYVRCLMRLLLLLLMEGHYSIQCWWTFQEKWKFWSPKPSVSQAFVVVLQDESHLSTHTFMQFLHFIKVC